MSTKEPVAEHTMPNGEKIVLCVAQGRGRQLKRGLQPGKWRWTIAEGGTDIAYGSVNGQVERADTIGDGMRVFKALQAEERIEHAKALADHAADQVKTLRGERNTAHTERRQAEALAARLRWHRTILATVLALGALLVAVLAFSPPALAAEGALSSDEVRAMIAEAFAEGERTTMGGLLNELWFVTVAALAAWLVVQIVKGAISTPHRMNPLQGLIRPDEDEARMVSETLRIVLEGNKYHGLPEGEKYAVATLANAVAQRSRARIIAGAIEFAAIFASMFIAFAPMAKGMLRAFF